jgi:hypothetical protein
VTTWSRSWLTTRGGYSSSPFAIPARFRPSKRQLQSRHQDFAKLRSRGMEYDAGTPNYDRKRWHEQEKPAAMKAPLLRNNEFTAFSRSMRSVAGTLAHGPVYDVSPARGGMMSLVAVTFIAASFPGSSVEKFLVTSYSWKFCFVFELADRDSRRGVAHARAEKAGLCTRKEYRTLREQSSARQYRPSSRRGTCVARRRSALRGMLFHRRSRRQVV